MTKPQGDLSDFYELPPESAPAEHRLQELRALDALGPEEGREKVEAILRDPSWGEDVVELLLHDEQATEAAMASMLVEGVIGRAKEWQQRQRRQARQRHRRQQAEARGFTVHAGSHEQDERHAITLGPDVTRVIDESIEALTGAERVFQREGHLCALVEVPQEDGSTRPQLQPMNVNRLRYYLASVARFERLSDEGLPLQRSPPKDILGSVCDVGHYPGVPLIRGVSSRPILRHDGSVCQTPGYDPLTASYFAPSVDYPPIPAFPTKADAEAALEVLLEPVVDFPFVTEADRSAYLAGALSPAAVSVHRSSTPGFVVNGNTPGVGKTKLAMLMTLIGTGQKGMLMSMPATEDEWRKRIHSTNLAAIPAAIVDNAHGVIGGDALEAALTGGDSPSGDRTLGASTIESVPNVTTWYVTANNASLASDMVRRVVCVRLRTTAERAGERQGFKFDDVVGHVTAHRARYCAAALTVLSAFLRSGERPPLSPFGSFETWSAVVRGSLAWLRRPDPLAANHDIYTSADPERAALTMLLAHWECIDRQSTGIKARDIIDELRRRPESYDEIRDALAELCPGPRGDLPSPRRLGRMLARYRETPAGGRWLVDSRASARHAALWRAVDIETPKPPANHRETP